MIDSSIIISCTALYLAALFYIAYRGDKQSNNISRFQPLIYTLSLTVYCSSWTFYGAVGNAAESGLSYFTIYLGPILVFVLFFPFLKKIIAAGKRHKTTSIADFIATRYGKSNRVSALVTLIAFVGTMPYIALQIKAIASSYDTLIGTSASVGVSAFGDTAFALAIILAVFSILFGARTIDASQHHKGLIYAIGFESIIKLISFCAIAFLAYSVIQAISVQNSSQFSTQQLLLAPFTSIQFSTDLITKTLLAAGAIFLLPRQFHVLAVEARGGEDASRWGLPLYLVLFSLAVVPVAAAGLLLVSSKENADLYVLLIPILEEHSVLSILAYLGGFSAATGMVIVATIALSTMVSNDLIFPFLVRFYKGNTKQEFHSILLIVRRMTIFSLVLLAYGYFYVGGADKSLHSVGLISFAAAIQFLPAVLASVYWTRGHRNGAFIGMLLGFLIWIYCLLLPSFSNSAWMPVFFIELMNDQQSFFNPGQLFGIEFDDALTHGVFWSLFFNIGAFIYFSVKARPSLVDRLQASSYIDQSNEIQLDEEKYKFKVADLFDLCVRFTGEGRAREYFSEHGYDVNALYAHDADHYFKELSERLLASSIGTATAEQLIRSAAMPEEATQTSLYGFIGQTEQAIEFNRELLQVTLDHIGQAVSVVDKDLRIMVWNRQYIEFFDYDAGFIRAGKPIDEVIRFNVERGYGPELSEDLEQRIQKRLDYLSNGGGYTFVRKWQNGKIIQTEGARMPDGGYITTYTDITPLKEAENRLAAINETLEAKVTERTEMLSAVNQQLEDVINSKTHFLAAASHDLVQPISASKLYMEALLEDLSGDESKQTLAKNSLSALTTAESLIKSLLHLSKLDSGVLKPDITYFSVNEVFNEIRNEFSVLASKKGLTLRIISAAAKATESDRSLLLSVLQNLVANAIRYTNVGTVLVICRRDSDSQWRIEVRDSGPGILLEKHEEIFHPFKQLSQNNKEGVGLGLAICRQASILLGHMISMKSQPGKGSVFSIAVPRKKDNVLTHQADENIVDQSNYAKHWLRGKNILCVDDDMGILQATRSLLERWGASIVCVNTASKFHQIVGAGEIFDLVLMDYQLGGEENGLDLLKTCKRLYGENFTGILVTAEQDASLPELTKENGFLFLEKPVEPAKLRSLIRSGITHDG